MLGIVTIKDDGPGDPTDDAATRPEEHKDAALAQPDTPAHPQALSLPTGVLGVAEAQTVAPELLADGELIGDGEPWPDAEDEADGAAAVEDETDAAPTVTADGVELMGTQEFRALFVDEDAEEQAGDAARSAVIDVSADPEHPVEPPPPTEVVQTIARRRWTRGLIIAVGLLLLLMLLGFAAALVGNMFFGPDPAEDSGVSALSAVIAAYPGSSE